VSLLCFRSPSRKRCSLRLPDQPASLLIVEVAHEAPLERIDDLHREVSEQRTQFGIEYTVPATPRVYNRWEKGGNLPRFDTIVKLADILQVSLDELADRKERSPELKIRNYELQRLCQQCDELPDEDQQALIAMMDSLLKKSHMTRVMGKVAAR